MKRKVLSLLLACSMVLGLAACGNTADTAQTPAAEEKTEKKAAAKKPAAKKTTKKTDAE